MKKIIKINEIPILVVIERFYDACFDEMSGTFDYEMFGEKVFEYMRKLGSKKFN